MGSDPDDARHFLFKKAFLLVEADFQSTVSHCCETLKLLGVRVVELDLESATSATLEACTNAELVAAFGGLYRIKLNTKDFKSVGTELEVEFLPYVPEQVVRLTRSSNVNRFVRIFTNG